MKRRYLVISICMLVLAGLLTALPAAAGTADPSRMAFSSDREDNLEIYAADPDGSNVVRLTTNPAEDRNPSWSPDGSQIAFDSDRDRTREIYLVAADGTGTVRLTDGADDAHSPAWSPDGSRVAFVAHCDETDSDDLFVMHPDGTGCTAVTATTEIDEYGPAWSPDGSQIAYIDRLARSDEVYSRVSAIGADGTGSTALFTTPGEIGRAAWSPDGSRIAYDVIRPESGGLFVLDLDTGDTARVRGTDAGDAAPAWSPDGSRLVVADGTGLTEVDLVAGIRTPLLSGTGPYSCPAWSSVSVPADETAGWLRACWAGTVPTRSR
jgi:Tol biopolymer transport system component